MSNAAVRKKMKLYKVCILGMLGVGTTAIKFRVSSPSIYLNLKIHSSDPKLNKNEVHCLYVFRNL